MEDFSHLKVGDKIFVKTWPRDELKTHMVKAITPKGFIKIDDGRLFYAGGYSRGNGFNHAHLYKYDDENIAHVKKTKRQEFVNDYFRHTIVSKLPDELLNKFYALIEEAKEAE